MTTASENSPSNEPTPSTGPGAPKAPDTSNDRLLIIAAHLSPLIGLHVIVPLVIYLVKKQDSPLVAEHAREALNFQITCMIAAFVGLITTFVCIGFVILTAVGIGSFVLAILAAIDASNDKHYRYPFTLRLI